MPSNAQQALERADAQKTAVATQRTAPQTIQQFLSDPRVKQQMSLALPQHMTADRLMRIALTQLRINPTLASCTLESFAGALFQSAQLGLEPGVLGKAYLIPRKNHGKMECQFQVGYKGLLDLARRSGEVKSIAANIVYDTDQFSYELGDEPKITHVPGDAEPSDDHVTHVYAVVKFTNGGIEREVMTKAQIEKIRQATPSGNSPAWKDHWGEMARKTVLIRVSKRCPMSVEFQHAVAADGTVKVKIEPDMALAPDADHDPLGDQVGEVIDAELVETVDPATGEVE